MKDAELKLLMIQGKCPKCKSTYMKWINNDDESMRFNCLDCGWSDTAPEKQILKYVVQAANIQYE